MVSVLRKSWGKPSSILLASSNLRIWSSVNSKSRQARLSRTCETFLAPTTGITVPFRCRIQLSATCEGERPTSPAILCTSAAMDRFLSLRPALPSESLFVSEALFCRSRRYLPVSTPPPSGDQASTPIPRARAIGSRSRSGVRSIRPYCACTPTKGVQPLSSARVLARATTQAGASEIPT